ncbi:MAG: DegT/DnrJ/EryC1/StrS family aminotransferase, partial [Micromonosporaceae bacterium]
GAEPRFVDVDQGTLLVTPETLEAGRTSRTAAVIAVHLYGHPADMDALSRYADQHGLALLEDAAQAHGAILDTPDPHRAGSYGVAGTFSFYPGKNFGAWGDGGAVVTDDEALATELRSLANHGRDADKHTHRVVGRNSRLDAVQAAVLSRKLPTLDAENRERRRIVERYRVALGPLAADLVEPVDPDASVWHLLVMRAGRRESLRKALARVGVDTGVHYPVPCHLTPAYAELPTPPLPVAEAAAGEVMSLPLWPGMSDQQVDRVVEQLWQALAKPAPSRLPRQWRPAQGGRR